MHYLLKASAVRRLIVLAVAVLCCAPLPGAKKRGDSSSASRQPKAAPMTRVPSEAAKFKPWGALRAYRVSEVQVSPPAPSPTIRASSFVTDPDKFKSIFNNAILFELKSGGRLVPSGSSKAQWLDYIEVRPNGTGFGVNADPTSQAHLYFSGARLIVSRDIESTAPAVLETDSEINYTGAGKEKRQAAHLIITADQVENFKKPAPEPTPEVKEKSKAKAATGEEEKSSGQKSRQKRKSR